jgi:dihydrofolate synthase/folylpolyglutamate synthase
MTAAILQAAGYRVGLYTSPHLVEFRERICVNGTMISEEAVTDLTERLRDLTSGELTPTFFEFTTAMAFQHFADVAVEIAVLEVGMGGRFDATNVIEPMVSAITSIALDHQDYLGHTIAAIAAEKAGVIKVGVPVIVGRVDQTAEAVIASVAAERQAPLARLGHEYRVAGETTADFTYTGRAWKFDRLRCPLPGSHQVENAGCALALVEAADRAGLALSAQAVRDGLLAVHWEGRLELLDQEPAILLDGAHNPAAAATLADYLRTYRRDRPGIRVVLVWGMMRDKDHRGFLAPLLPMIDEVVLTQADLARAATVHELQSSLGPVSVPIHVSPLPTDALSFARRLASPTDLICVSGSLMLVGDVKAVLSGSGLSSLRG